jgi:uncharacterized protein (UPF0303 family)
VPDDAPSIEEIARDEGELLFDAFDHDVAVDLGLHVLAAAREAGLGVTIDIRKAGQQVFHAALPGTSPDNDAWAERKARAVARFHKSSLRLGLECKAAGTTLEERFLLPPNEFAAHGGSFPITVRGTGVVGAVTISGLPQVEDHRLVVACLRSFLAAR